MKKLMNVHVSLLDDRTRKLDEDAGDQKEKSKDFCPIQNPQQTVSTISCHIKENKYLGLKYVYG